MLPGHHCITEQPVFHIVSHLVLYIYASEMRARVRARLLFEHQAGCHLRGFGHIERVVYTNVILHFQPAPPMMILKSSANGSLAFC